MGSDLPLKVLFVVPYAPTRIRTRPLHLLRTLVGQGHHLALATLSGGDEDDAAIDALRPGLEHVISERLPAMRSLWNCARALPGKEPLQAHYSWSPALAQRIAGQISDWAPDVVHVEHLRGVRYGLVIRDWVARRQHRRPAVIWDSVDCISELFRCAAQHSRSRRMRLAVRLELPRTERYEGQVAAGFDRVLVTSEPDRRGLIDLAERWSTDRRGTAPAAERFVVVPMGVDRRYFAPAGAPREPNTLVFAGKMSYHANVTAAVHFVEDVMPLVWAARPGVRLWIVGKDPSPEVSRLGQPWQGAWPADRVGRRSEHDGRVAVTGTVDDVRPFLRRATLAVAPLRYAVGTQNKVLEAMACGTPVVATPPAVAALQATSGAEVAVAQEPADLARIVLALLQDADRRAAMSRHALSYVEREHDWDRIVKRLVEVYRDAGA